MTDTFVPPVCPDFERSKSVTARVLGAQFGDGYTQRAGDGLNAIARTLGLTWQSLSVADAQTIEDFFLTHSGYLAFLYAGNDSVTRKWIVRQWQRTELREGGKDAIAATLEQVFDL